MRKICSSVLLLSDNDNFIEHYKELAEACDITLHVEPTWHKSYRVNEEVIICGTKYIELLAECYYPVTTLILKERENFPLYIRKGFENFIFDFKNDKELTFAFTRADRNYIKSNIEDIGEELETCNATSYVNGDYAFYFDKNVFKYKGKRIFLTKCYQKYLIEWLLQGNRDINKRPYLYKMRKTFGEDFLRDIDRYGQLIRK